MWRGRTGNQWKRARRIEDEQTLGLSQRLRLAVEAGQFGVWDFDVPKASFAIDAQQVRLYGVPESTREVSFDDWCGSVHRDDLRRVQAEFLNVVRFDRAYDLSFRIHRCDGSVRCKRCWTAAPNAWSGRCKSSAARSRAAAC